MEFLTDRAETLKISLRRRLRYLPPHVGALPEGGQS